MQKSLEHIMVDETKGTPPSGKVWVHYPDTKTTIDISSQGRQVGTHYELGYGESSLVATDSAEGKAALKAQHESRAQRAEMAALFDKPISHVESMARRAIAGANAKRGIAG